MPDAKYSDDKIALKYSAALYPPQISSKFGRAGHFEIMKKSIKEMHRQVGDLVIDEKGIAKKGLLVRHLVLPNNLACSEKIFQFLAKEISKNTFLNVMSQYFPHYRAREFPELNRPITSKEYQEAIELAKKAGLKRLYHE